MLRTPTSTTGSGSCCSPSPAWAVLVTVGLAQALAWARRRGRIRAGRRRRPGRPRRARRRPGNPVPLPVQLLQRRPRRDRRARDVRLLADQRARAASGHPHRRPDRLRADPVEPARRTGRQCRAPRASTRRAMLAGPLLLDSSVDCRTDSLGPLVVQRGRPRAGLYDDTASARRVLRDHRPRPRGAGQLHAAGRGDPFTDSGARSR